jgi:hypothetical protein
MSTDDKFGIGAGLMALGLAAGVILIGQLTYDKATQAELDKVSVVSSDPAKPPQAESAPVPKPSIAYRLIPHREPIFAEEIFDGIVFALALPAGIVFFVMGTLSGGKETESDPEEEG